MSGTISLLWDLRLRQIQSTSKLRIPGEFEMEDPKSPDEVVNVTFVTKDETRKQIKGKVGDNLMYLAHRYLLAH